MNENIATPRLLLRKYCPQDKEIIADFFTDEVVAQFMGDGPCEEREDAYNLFDEFFQVYENTSGKHHEVWGIEWKGNLIGHVELKTSEYTQANELEIVYLLNEPYWNQGLMTEVLFEIQKHARKFNKQLIALVKSKNEASLSVLDKIGIQNEFHQNEAKSILKITLLP
jgi:RimJ/RimL family protein N-acetyltransferase